jgi:hypothetical protein
MSDVIDAFCIFFCFKEINKATEESRNMLSKQAYINRKRYDQIFCLKKLQQPRKNGTNGDLRNQKFLLMQIFDCDFS